jgi:hypothetical protein
MESDNGALLKKPPSLRVAAQSRIAERENFSSSSILVIVTKSSPIKPHIILRKTPSSAKENKKFLTERG